MRIISKHKDYYDSVTAGHGTDPKRVYVRKTQELFPPALAMFPDKNAAKNPFEGLHRILKAMPAHTDDCGVVAFCGKAYPYYSLVRHGKGSLEYGAKAHWTHCYSWEDVVRHYERDLAELEKRLLDLSNSAQDTAILLKNRKSVKEDLKAVTSTKEDTSNSMFDGLSFGSTYLTQRKWDRFIHDTDLTVPDSVFREVRAPVLCVDWEQHNTQIRVEVNPVLKHLGFASVVDPYTAHQTLEMFMGTNMVTQMDPEVHVSDEIKAESHGFNKHSFRSDPTRKTKRRKMRK